MKNTYTHIRFEERFVIEKLYGAGKAIREIASFLGRSPNTISREIDTNSVQGTYTAEKADHKAYAKRWRAKHQCLKVAMDGFLIRFVEERIQKPYRWSPRQISGYLKEKLSITCSAKAIYKFIESRGLERNLFWKWNKKKGGRKRTKHAPSHDNRKYIDTRPEIQGEYGHYEVDFIVSKESTWVFLVIVETLTKHTWVLKLPNRKRTTIRDAFSKVFSGISVKSITTDNDIAFTAWQELETMIQAPVYFCHPYHSWEKGLVENTNRWIRCFVPKRRDIGTVSENEMDEIHTFLNDRPRECIGFRSPREYYESQFVLLEG
jgi:IS30 family transposase